MNFADNIPATVKSGMIICAIGVVIHFCIVCIVSNRITLILTLLLGIFEGFFFWIILAYIDAMETFLLCRIERSGLILSISSDYKSVYPNGCSDCDIIEAWHPHDLLEKTQGLTQSHFQPQNGYSLLGSFHVDARLLLCHNHYIHLGRLTCNQN